MALAWVAVLASALAAHDRGFGNAAHDASRDADVAAIRQSPVTPQPAASSTLPDISAELIEFARELHGTLESDRLRLIIARRLPSMLGIRDVWIVARFGSRQQIILPTRPTAEGLPFVSDEPRQWSTFPMKADGQTIGLMGVGLPPEGFTDHDQRQFKLVASLVAQSLSTANAFETMREASLVDPLTGCATRGEGERRFEAELRRAHRAGTSLAVLMLDLDHFKSINDLFGHKAGDAVLSAVGDTLLTTLRASDVRCRWGGEEFLLILPDSNVERAQRAADKLRRRIASTPVGADDRIINVTASIGLTLSHSNETDIQQLTARADAALYEAKRLGRNCVSIVLADADPPHRVAEHPHPMAIDRGASTAHSAAGVVSAGSAAKWDGIERRDAGRADRRRVKGSGRRATDGTYGRG
jgi:diguanylate cyclase (GGDEF)-like protein